MMCDNCKSKESYVKLHKHSYKIKNQIIEFDSKRRFCMKCNNLIYDDKLDNEASIKAIKLYNQKYGINASDIVNLRKKYNLSQDAFSKVIGCAKKTLISYENSKSIPNDIYMITLKTLIDNPSLIINFMESNVNRFSINEYETISNKIYNSIETNLFQIENNVFIPSEYNGYTKISIDKIKNLLIMLCKNGINKTKLLKEMFYVDYLCYKRNGSSVTGLSYCKLPYGPVPDNYQNILDKLSSEEIIKCESKIKNEYLYIIYNSNKKENIKEFNKDEINIINYVINYFKDYSSEKIENFSHLEKAYKESNFYKKISYDYAFDLSIGDDLK